MPPFANKQLTVGQEFGKLIVAELLEKRVRGQRMCRCVCACGEQVITSGVNLRGGQQSCKKCAHGRDPKTALRESFKSYIKGAEKRSLVFSLTFDEFVEIVSRNCHYCDAHPRQTCWSKAASISVAMNGVDRLNSNVGYLLTNCVPCCGQCNRSKSLMSATDFINWAKLIALKWSSK